jgi:hypothetical protein
MWTSWTVANVRVLELFVESKLLRLRRRRIDGEKEGGSIVEVIICFVVVGMAEKCKSRDDVMSAIGLNDALQG